MASEDLKRSVLNCRSTWASNLPRLWVLEVLACSKEADVSLLLDLVKKTPEIFEDIGKNAREWVSLRILESFYDQGVRVDSVSKKIIFDPSEQCEDVLRRILSEASVSDLKTAGVEMLKWDFQPFIVHKRSSLAKCSLPKLKDAILIGSHPLPASLKEQSGLQGGTQPEDKVPVDENNDNDITTYPDGSNTNDQLIYPTLANCSNPLNKNKPGQNLLLSKRKRSSTGKSDGGLLTDASMVIVQQSLGERCTLGHKSHVVGLGKICSPRDDDKEHTPLKRHAGPNEVWPCEEQVHNFVPADTFEKDSRGLHLLADALIVILKNSEGNISDSVEKTNIGGMGTYAPFGVCKNNQTSTKCGINLDEILQCEKQSHHFDIPNDTFDEEQKQDHDVKDAEGDEECVSELNICKKVMEPQNLQRNVCETESDNIFCGNDVFNDDMTDIARRKNAFLDSQVTHFQESLEKIDWRELNRCIKCYKSGKLLICSSSSCFLAIHKSCLSSDAIFERMEEFYCPFCAYSLALSKYLEVKAMVSLARKDLATFVSGESRSCGIVPNHLKQDDDSHKSKQSTDSGKIVNKLHSREKNECEEVSPTMSSSSDNPPRKGVASTDVLTKDLNKGKREGEGMGQESQSPRVHGQSQMGATANHISQDESTEFRSKKEVLCPPGSDFLSESTPLPINESTDEDEISGEGSEDSGFSKYFISIRNHKERSSNPGTPQLKRKRVPWTVEEEQTLKNGMQRFCGDHNKSIPWKQILDYGENVFHECRTTVDLKDKWRNVKKLLNKFDPSDEDAQMT